VHVVTPKVFLIAETCNMLQGQQAMFEAIGAHEWKPPEDTFSAGEGIVEIAGRLCYKSFGTELNKNLTRVREGNNNYIGNILKTKHGSVLEHATTTVAFINVSRILTHELCRHRAGTAISQESMRFVRLDNIPMYVPNLKDQFYELADYNRATVEDGNNASWAEFMQRTLEKAFGDIARHAESAIVSLSIYLDKEGVPFGLKKAITSALRRMAPGGHTTNIIMTANHRAWRHMLELRTALTEAGDLTAEVEIHDVFIDLGKQLKARYPAFYQDATLYTHSLSGNKSWQFANSKI
jgi:thymidylate synthase (FAD)